MTRKDILFLSEDMYKLHAKLKHQGSLSDVNTLNILSEKYGISTRTVSRYLRLQYLIPSLKELYVVGRINMKACVEISYLDIKSQAYITDYLLDENSISLRQAEYLRREFEETGCVDIKFLLSNKIAGSVGLPKCQSLYIKYNLYRYTKSELTEILDKALEDYFSRLRPKW
ncbi:MAG: hypothetical protein IJE43_19135 [Alphaproteobacteria bacterium]|nr:hypothetical protein [Alphaproteobacteria bacterium]